MKGISFLINDNNETIAVQIDLKVLDRYRGRVEELTDGIIAQSRKDEQKIPINKVIKNLKKTRKLK